MSKKSKKIIIERGSLVSVYWDDSRQSAGDWCHVSKYRTYGVAKCRTVGWVIHVEPESISLAQSRGDYDIEKPNSFFPSISDEQVSGITVIPSRCVTKVELLIK